MYSWLCDSRSTTYAIKSENKAQTFLFLLLDGLFNFSFLFFVQTIIEPNAKLFSPSIILKLNFPRNTVHDRIHIRSVCMLYLDGYVLL